MFIQTAFSQQSPLISLSNLFDAFVLCGRSFWLQVKALVPCHWLVLTKRLQLKCIHVTTEFSRSGSIWHHYFCFCCCWLAPQVNPITKFMGRAVRRIVWMSTKFYWSVVVRSMLFLFVLQHNNSPYFDASNITSFAITAAASPLAWMLPWNSYYGISFWKWQMCMDRSVNMVCTHVYTHTCMHLCIYLPTFI